MGRFWARRGTALVGWEIIYNVMRGEGRRGVNEGFEGEATGKGKGDTYEGDGLCET